MTAEQLTWFLGHSKIAIGRCADRVGATGEGATATFMASDLRRLLEVGKKLAEEAMESA